MKYLRRLSKRQSFLMMICFLCVLSGGSMFVMANERLQTVDTEQLTVWTGPGNTYETVTQLNQSDQIHQIETISGWTKIRTTTDKVGWIPEHHTAETASPSYLSGEIVTDSAIVYANPSSEASVLGHLSSGEQVSIIEHTTGWTNIIYADQTGWISTDSIQLMIQDTRPSDATSTITMLEHNANIRSRPSLDAAIIGEAFAYQSYDYIGKVGDWFEIRLSETTTGFVYSEYAHSTDPNDLAPSEITEVPSLSESVIVIDPGHGGMDPGAVYNNTYEKNIALSTSLYLQQQLEAKGARVIMTRDTDVDVGLDERADISNSSQADVFISIHFDATGVRNSVSGTTTYYYSDADLPLAEAINQLLEADGLLGNNGIHMGNYHVLRNNRQPSILVELGYMDNDQDYALISTDHYHKAIANTLLNGLESYFQSAQHPN